MWDHDGNIYLDFFRQLVYTNLGHQHPKGGCRDRRPGATADHRRAPQANPTRAEAAEPITARAPEGFNEVFFTTGGADPEVLGPGLGELAAKHELVGEVRGVGVFCAIELVANRTTKVPLATSAMAQLKQDLLDRGLLPFAVDNRIHVVPPANIDVSDAQHGLAVIDAVLTAFAG